MLPVAVYEKLIHATRLRSDQGSGERRDALRLPLRVVIVARPVKGDLAPQGFSVRVRDISRSGIALLSTCEQDFGHEFLIAFAEKSAPIILWCRAIRRSDFDRTCTVTSAIFLRMLDQDQRLSARSSLNALRWVEFTDSIKTAC